ncbi:hypothetical protein QBC34DRAFT_88229 [Podospora aff. communis PSN243]|uniref:Uncharacterized protein n=1 Tax=Podospora aff. communis PSN243 TaxID=3040156 RepID=A0AAV9GP56_9PEZI|nr:hypothetical protein QBC34DRAFT_88229 [Podospora aff. communis PSN243]
MENDQFGGRTDDDLFADDFEPVAPEEQVSIVTPAVVETQTQPAVATTHQTEAAVPPAAETPAAAPKPQPPKSLAQSRHNRPDKGSRPAGQNNNNNPKSAAAKATPAPAPTPVPAPDASTASATSSAPPSAPKAPAAVSATPAKYASSNTASVNSEARLASGANPRTKLTEDQLAAKMEKMRLVNAEKTRRFEQAQRDESAHAEALARSQEEAKKRREEEAKKRRAAEEDRRKLDDERAKNRERKMNAMRIKEGGWDEGKEDRLAEEDGRDNFRSAHGGVRGLRGGGLSGSRYASGGDDVGGRGRAGRGGRGGREGRALFDPEGDRQDRHNHQLRSENWDTLRDQEKQQKKQAVPKPEEFPALPSAGKTQAKPKDKAGGSASKKIDTAPASKAVAPADMGPFSPVGQWDEEVAASLEPTSRS